MAQQRKKASTASRKATEAAARPLLKDIADPAPFFSLTSAQFRDAIVVTKVISVVLPLRHLRDRTILHEMVLKKLLHRSFEPSAEDLAQQHQDHPESGPSPSTTTAAAVGSSSSSSPSAPTLSDVYVIVHIKSAEVHADTARQINPQGDVQVNVMTTLVASRVQHGLIAGVAEASAFATCMQVRLPSVTVSAAVGVKDSGNVSDVVELESVKLESGEEGEEGEATLPTHSHKLSMDRQLRVTARCLEDEPVVPGQAVLLVSEPAAMRCLAIRPPRDAPGPFFFSADTTVDPTGVAVTKRKRATRKRGEEGMSGSAGGRRVVVLECEIPDDAETTEGPRKRPRW